MLNVFQLKDVERIRDNFADNLLFNTLRDACRDCCERPEYFRFQKEHVFVEVVRLLDELKQKQEGVQWDNLCQDLRQDYRLISKDLPGEELNCITCTIVVALASVLLVSTPRFYHEISKNLFLHCARYVPASFENALNLMMDKIEERGSELRLWIDEYMQSDVFISDGLEQYISTIKEEGVYISFSKEATSEQRTEFRSVLNKIIRDKQKRGKAQTIKTTLAKYRTDGVIVLSGTDADIFRELKNVYNADISSTAFFDAEPKLMKK